MDYIRARREVRHALVISDPLPIDSAPKVWASAGQAAAIGIFLLLFVAFLYIGHAIMLPVLAAGAASIEQIGGIGKLEPIVEPDRDATP